VRFGGNDLITASFSLKGIIEFQKVSTILLRSLGIFSDTVFTLSVFFGSSFPSCPFSARFPGKIRGDQLPPVEKLRSDGLDGER